MHDVYVCHVGILLLGFNDVNVRHVGSEGVKQTFLTILIHKNIM